MHPNAQLLHTFYSAFQRRDADTMARCYAASAHFSDAVFTDLNGPEVTAMWRMLTGRAKDFSLEFDSIEADDQQGRAHWVARYTFAATGKPVINDIQAAFRFRDGLIVDHKDSFDLYRWSSQALGASGRLLGWTPFMQKALRRKAAKGLAEFMAHG